MGEARQFNLGVQTDVHESSAYVIGYPRMGCIKGHITSLFFWKITYYTPMSEMAKIQTYL